MFTANIDLGQVILIVLIGGLGWFVKKEIVNVNKRLDKHDEILLGLMKDVAQLIGINLGARQIRAKDFGK